MEDLYKAERINSVEHHGELVRQTRVAPSASQFHLQKDRQEMWNKLT